MSSDPGPAQVPRTLRSFARAVGTELPERLLTLRRLGKATKALPRARRDPRAK